MGNRSIFLYHHQVRYHDGVTQKDNQAKSYGYGRWNLLGGSRRQIRAGINAEKGVRSRKTRKRADSTLPRKTSKEN